MRLPSSSPLMRIRVHDSALPLNAIALIALVAVALSFWWQGNMGFSLWDEGYLWYGAQRVMLGEVPILDFAAYEPGRYYWSAALMHVFGGDGIMSLRLAVVVFQCAGLFAGLWVVSTAMRGSRSGQTLYLILAAVVLMSWMFPRHKLFDVSASLLLLATITWLASTLTPSRFFLAGLSVGIVALFGRNHGLYGAVASIGYMLWLMLSREGRTFVARGILPWAAGVLVGFSPVLFMAALIPGFAAAFLDSVLFHIQFGATNLPLPVPWPWTVPVHVLSTPNAVRLILAGFFFIALLVFGVISIGRGVLRYQHPRAIPPALVASTALVFPYAHFAFSRPDIGHLSQGIFPLVVGCLVLLARLPALQLWTLASVLCATSMATMLSFHPGWVCRFEVACTDVDIAGRTLRIDPDSANAISLIRQMSAQHSPQGEPFFTAPYWPGAYAVMRQRAPNWEIYAVVPRPPAFEQMEIERLAKSQPRFVVIFDLPLDGREELRYRYTHPLMYRYIQENFKRIPYPQVPSYEIYLPQ